MAEADFRTLLEQIASAHEAGQPGQEMLRTAAEFLDDPGAELPDPRRERVLAQVKALLVHAPLVQAVAGAPDHAAGRAALWNV
jgi:hypothetical protein